MSVRVGDLVFHDWESLQLPGGWSDTFIFRMSPTDGLPPADYAGVVRALAVPLRTLRPNASLWVQVSSMRSEESRKDAGKLSGDHPKGERMPSADPALGMASWYRNEVRYALRGLRLPVAVTKGRSRPELWDFSFFPVVDRRPGAPPPSSAPLLNEEAYRPSELACLRVLARSDCAYTAEVASLAGLSRTAARSALRRLGDRRLVTLKAEKKFPLWKICRPGLSVALRSWGLPPGYAFRKRKERGVDACEERLAAAFALDAASVSKEKITFWAGVEGKGKLRRKITFESRPNRTAGRRSKRSGQGRHRRTARLWPAWLREALPQAKICCGWTEVNVARSRPDALCWGWHDSRETLFWLEVESGHLSRVELRRQTIRRINQALVFARRASAKLIFAVLGPAWVLEAVRESIRDLPLDLAVLLEDWKHFGELASPVWGRSVSG